MKYLQNPSLHNLDYIPSDRVSEFDDHSPTKTRWIWQVHVSSNVLEMLIETAQFHMLNSVSIWVVKYSYLDHNQLELTEFGHM